MRAEMREGGEGRAKKIDSEHERWVMGAVEDVEIIVGGEDKCIEARRRRRQEVREDSKNEEGCTMVIHI